MRRRRFPPRAGALALAALLALPAPAAIARAVPAAGAAALEPPGAAVLRGLDPARLHTGVLYDRVLPLSGIERFDGRAGTPPATRATWLQMMDELRRAALEPPAGPGPAGLLEEVHAAARRDPAIPLAVLDRAYQRLRPGALDRLARSGATALAADDLLEARAFALAALVDHTGRGGEVSFVLEPRHWFGSDPAAVLGLEIDFGDGAGARPVRFGERVRVHYDAPGPRVLRLVTRFADGTAREARARFEVRAVATVTPDDTLHVTATLPYRGAVASGDAYVRLAPGHARLVNPVIVLEGFDLDNSMNWDEIYALLDQQGLADTLSARGFDEVVLNFTDATDWIQRNAFVATELIQEVEGAIAPDATVALAGASMGGLVGRYALAWLEAHGVPHRVRTFISFDAPQKGADIPLGIQYWMKFFSSQSADAAWLLGRLNTPAARQMLLYHYTSPPGATGQPDSVRAGLLADLVEVGGYPTAPRRVAIANGSGTRADQGFLPGDQLIRWEYTSLWNDITGDVWALPDATSHDVFKGKIRILFSTTQQTVTLSGTLPWDGAPGGSRATMAEMDATPAPYGDIVALHPSHCFVPVISALDLDTGDPFYDVAGDPALASHTPFDAVYFPLGANQEHMTITAESAAWVQSEIERGVASVDRGARAAPALRAWPNPGRGRTAVEFDLPRSGPAALRVFGVDGREVATLAAGALAAGRHRAAWDGRDRSGRPAAPGVYLLRLESQGRSATTRLARIR